MDGINPWLNWQEKIEVAGFPRHVNLASLPLQFIFGGKFMKDSIENTKENTAQIEPCAMFHSGGTTFLIGLSFASKGDTLEDKVKKMIRKEVKDGSF